MVQRGAITVTKQNSTDSDYFSLCTGSWQYSLQTYCCEKLYYIFIIYCACKLYYSSKGSAVWKYYVVSLASSWWHLRAILLLTRVWYCHSLNLHHQTSIKFLTTLHKNENEIMKTRVQTYVDNAIKKIPTLK